MTRRSNPHRFDTCALVGRVPLAAMRLRPPRRMDTHGSAELPKHQCPHPAVIAVSEDPPTVYLALVTCPLSSRKRITPTPLA